MNGRVKDGDLKVSSVFGFFVVWFLIKYIFLYSFFGYRDIFVFERIFNKFFFIVVFLFCVGLGFV